MPRSIIDTESSRGRLVRRRAIVTLLVIVVVLALLFVAWTRLHAAPSVGFQGNSPPRLNLGLREYAT